MSKKVNFGAKPQATAPASGDEWVRAKPARQQEPTKRLTLDIPARLHAQFKSQCALKGVKMAEVVQELIERKVGLDGVDGPG